MKDQKEATLSYWAHHLTSVVSVTLVLLLVGIIALIWISADTETRRLKERIELSVIMADSVPASAAVSLAERLRAQPYAKNVKVVTREDALQAWKEDTGEDLLALFGVNPLSEEVTFGVRAQYASADMLNSIADELREEPGVEAVSIPDAGMIDAMNDNIETLTIILAVIAAIMLVISFVLINNTVHLTIHSRRFTIHTMKLVGATNSFIRRPFIMENILAGLISGCIAAAIMAISMAAAKSAGIFDLASFIGWGAYGIVAGSMIVIGMIICGLASCLSANRFLRKDYDSLFK